MCILFVAISMTICCYEMEGALAVTDENKAEKEGAMAAAAAATVSPIQCMIISCSSLH